MTRLQYWASGSAQYHPCRNPIVGHANRKLTEAVDDHLVVPPKLEVEAEIVFREKVNFRVYVSFSSSSWKIRATRVEMHLLSLGNEDTFLLLKHLRTLITKEGARSLI